MGIWFGGLDSENCFNMCSGCFHVCVWGLWASLDVDKGKWLDRSADTKPAVFLSGCGRTSMLRREPDSVWSSSKYLPFSSQVLLLGHPPKRDSFCSPLTVSIHTNDPPQNPAGQVSQVKPQQEPLGKGVEAEGHHQNEFANKSGHVSIVWHELKHVKTLTSKTCYISSGLSYTPYLL